MGRRRGNGVRGALVAMAGAAGLLALTTLLVVGASPSAAQTETATIEIVNRISDPTWQKPVLVYAATADGRRSEPPVYDGTDSTISIDPGCWVIASPNRPYPVIYNADDGSRPYITVPGSSVAYQQHAVCLDAGETYVFDNEISSGLGGRRPSLRFIVVDPAGEPLEGVTVDVLDSTGAPQTMVLGPDGRGTRSVFADAFTIVSINHPAYTFESPLIGRRLGGLDQGWYSFVGSPVGNPPDPATVTVDLPSTPVAFDVRFEVEITRDGDEPFQYRHRSYHDPEPVVAQLGAGCYVAQLFAFRGDVLFTDVDRAIRRTAFCLEPGEDLTIDPGDLALATVSGDFPFIPIDVDDQFGRPVAAVNATFFYPRADLTPADLRRFDHRSDDARGQFYQSVTTGADGRALMPNYTECMVVTLEAPAGYTFPNGRWEQQTVCESQSVTVVATGGDDPGPDPTTSLGGRVLDANRTGVGGVVIDLFASDPSAQRLAYLRSTASGDDGGFTFEFDAAGCYVVTFIAPDGSVFSNGTRWLNQHRCLAEGERVDDILASLASDAPEPGRVSALVFDGPTRDVVVDGVAVDLFTAAGDGSRGPWIEQVQTGPGDEFEVDAGCYVVTFIAPAGRTFVDTGTQWVNRPFCIESGDLAQVEANLDSP